MSDDVETLETFIFRERERLNDRRGALLEQRGAIDTELAGIDREMEAVAAYEAAKTGKSTTAAAPRKRRGHYGSVRANILDAVRGSATGMSREQLIDFFGYKGDKSGEGSISNALTQLKKRGELVHVGKVYQINPERGNEAEATSLMNNTRSPPYREDGHGGLTEVAAE